MLNSFRNVTVLSDFLKRHSCAGYEIADNSWIVVSGASPGGETGVGADSDGVERDTDLDWPPSGPCP